MSGIKTFENILKNATGFKAGEYQVTCPKCQTEGRGGKFCTVCGTPITAINYETIIEAMKSGKMDNEEMISALNEIHEFRVGGESSMKMLEKIKNEEMILSEI